METFKERGKIQMEKLRTTKIYEDGKWKRIEFKDLKKDDVFRLYEPDTNELVIWKDENGNPIKGDTGTSRATTDAKKDKEGIWGIKCDPYEIETKKESY